MKMNRVYLAVALLTSGVLLSCSNTIRKKGSEQIKEVEKIEIRVKKELITFLAADGLTITGDLYTHQNKENIPFIILFHQAGYSRGEYNNSADKFLELGYNCLAIDQRSGSEVNGVINKTHKLAVDKGLPTEYTDAMPDLEAAINYVKDSLKPEKLFILGSSYSSVLSLIIAAQNPDAVDAVLAFSPGEYFEYKGTSIIEYAKEISVPVFITSAKSEYNNWKAIFEAIPGNNKVKYIPEIESIHGSSALWKTTEGSEDCWKAVEQFLEEN